MSSTTEHKAGLPILGPSPFSSLIFDKSQHTPVLSKSKMSRDLLFFRQQGAYESSPVNHVNKQLRQDHQTVYESTSNLEANKARNLKIDDVIKKASKKLNFSNRDKTKRFEEKMKIFENLNTFVDIKDFLQQMNVLNQDTKKTVKLPPIHVGEGYELAHQISSPSSNLNLTLRNQDSFGSPSVGKTGNLNKSLMKGDNEFPDKLKSLRTHISKFAASKEEESLHSDRKKDTYGLILDKANVMLTQLNEADKKLPIVEDTDVNTFYQELQVNLANNNFEKIDYGNVRLQQEEMDYYKNLLTFKEEESESMNQKYYDAYKARAEKVIMLLRKATKNIYKKVTDEKKIPKSRYHSGEATDKETKVTKGTEVKEFLKQQFEVFITADKLMEEQQQTVPDLDAQFKKMLRRVNSMVSMHKSGSKVNYINNDDQTNENHLNHEINKAHKNYLKTILDCVDYQGNNYKSMKENFKKKIDKLEDAYDKDIQKLLPKNLESIKMTLDVGSTNKYYVDKPVRKNISRKMLNVLNN